MTPAARLIWVQMYERTGDAGLTCRRCGVSRPTLRQWWRRYLAARDAGLQDRSRRPLNSPGRRVLAEAEQRILTLLAAAFDPTREFILARDTWPRPRPQSH